MLYFSTFANGLEESPQLGRGLWGGSPRGNMGPTLTPCLSPPTALECTVVKGSVYSRCGPSCPRSCDDISVRAPLKLPGWHPTLLPPLLLMP